MAGTAQYTPTQIYWLLLQWYHFKIRSINILGPEFERIFGRPLAVQQLKYVTTKYGKDPDYGCPYYDANPPHPKTRDGAELENVPLGPASIEAHAEGTRSRRPAANEAPAGRQRDIRANLPYGTNYQTANMPRQPTNLRYDTNDMPSQTNNVPSQTNNMPSQMNNMPSQTANMPSQTMEIPGNARQEPNGGSSAVTETRQLNATRSPTSHEQRRPRQIAPAFVPAMPTADRASRGRRRLDMSRGLAWQQAHIDAQADERIEQQLQQRLYMQQMQQAQQIQHAWQLQQLLLQAQGMPVTYHPASHFLDYWPQSSNRVLTQHAQHSQHAQLDQPMRQDSGFTHPENFVGSGPALTANRYPDQLLLQVGSPQQVPNVVAQQWHTTQTQHLPEMGPRVTEMLEAGNEAASDAVADAAEPSLWEVPEQGAVEQSAVEQVAAAETEATQQEVGVLPEETREEPEAPSSPEPAESQQQNLMLPAEAEEEENEEVNFFDLLQPLTNSANEPLLGDDPADFDFTEVDAMAREAQAMAPASIGQSNASQVHEEAPAGAADNFSFEDFLNATEDQDYVFFPSSDNPESLTEPPNEDLSSNRDQV